MSSNLTGKFIANTYQKLLQVDNVNGSSGTANFTVADVKNGTYDLLNGIGQELPYMVVNHKENGNGGYFIRKGDTDDDVVGLQIEDYSGKGIQFWCGTPSSNGNLFLKNTGSLWVGYRDATGDIYNDVNNYTLYVNKGIHLNKEDQDRAYISVADGSNTIDGRLYIRAKNHRQNSNQARLQGFTGAPGNTLYGQAEDHDIVSSGVMTEYIDPQGNGDIEDFEIVFQIIWQRVGNIVSCQAFVNHFNANLWAKDPNTGTIGPHKFNVPLFTDGFEQGTFDTLHGHGINTTLSAVNVPFTPVVVKRDSLQTDPNTGNPLGWSQWTIVPVSAPYTAINNRINFGISTVSFSYELKSFI